MHLVMSDNELQDMKQLLHRVSLLYDNLLGPVCQHRVSILHPYWHGWGKNFQSLSHNIAGLNCMRLQQTVKNCNKHPVMFALPCQYNLLSPHCKSHLPVKTQSYFLLHFASQSHTHSSCHLSPGNQHTL